MMEDGAKDWTGALHALCRRATLAIESGYTLLILSDRGVDPDWAPIPSLLALTAVHNHLVRQETRTQVALIVESGEPREVMHYALLIGYGASAVNPYLAIETLEDMALRGQFPGRPSLSKPPLRTTPKPSTKACSRRFGRMGISTLQSYRGAQVFEAIGLNSSLVDKYFTGPLRGSKAWDSRYWPRRHGASTPMPLSRSTITTPNWRRAAPTSTALRASTT